MNTLLIFGAGSGVGAELVRRPAKRKTHLIQTEAHGRVRRSDVALHIQQLLASGEGRGKVFALCDTTPEGERF
ncbi:hypothetical protein ACE2AK_23375 [Rahnella perminowiae]|uniref:hypothetical protein n=1 Tax=Rahnella perminowiae TaxID=2816244 RepID=UPI0036598607